MVSPLDRKLLRDLWRMKLQSFAIALVIAVGVLLLVMMDGLVNSLAQTRDAYYDRYRLAEVFAPVKRAPDHLLDGVERERPEPQPRHRQRQVHPDGTIIGPRGARSA